RYSEEIRRGMTIKLGYANAVIMKCPRCLPPDCYQTYAMSKGGKCIYCGADLIPLRKVSFVDSPGHDMLIATMLSGAAIMDAAILVIDATVPCPQPQTREHLKALEIIGLKNIVIVQNKLDVVTKDRALENYKEIKDMISSTFLSSINPPVIPISALHKANLDILVESFEVFFPNPQKDEQGNPLIYAVRSFDTNKPGTKLKDLRGGVIGGSIIRGRLRVGDEIEIKPGYKVKKDGKITYVPLQTKVVSLKSEDLTLKEAVAGGLIGIETELDPSITKGDQLVGNVIGLVGKTPPVWNSLRINFNLFDIVVGIKEPIKVEPMKIKEELVLNVGPARTVGIVSAVKGDIMTVNLSIPVCAELKTKVAISRKVAGKWRLVGYGEIV
ncbi:MAG TPA: translation initiation factor IF-2 subunit gamma, partial [Geobacterales bacterium]|nr:translation initiation factor IF-2 subunit gamma [Geobacterales bacterium]